MATPPSTKPHRPPPEAYSGPDSKRAKPSLSHPQDVGTGRVLLNPADRNLDFDIEENGLEGHALNKDGFAYCWSGARATMGINGGRFYFGCKIISEQMVEMEDTPVDQQHVCRVGISRGDDPVGNLGESAHSFGYGGTGKFSNAGKFVDYGTKFGIGDIIICAVDLENKPNASITFYKNGQNLGVARLFDAGPGGLGVLASPPQNFVWASALFPHVLLKNVVVKMQFCLEDGLIHLEGYKPWNAAFADGNAVIGPSFFPPDKCEVIMLVGLPASGKTTWAEKWVKEHPEKRYVLLGTNLALDQMKVPGLMRKHNYGERFDRLMSRATGIFNTLLARAAKIPLNYILDQTNVYKSARKRKLKEFMDYHKIAVVVFPMPDELKSRAQKRFKEMGKEVPADAVNEMLANYVLPTSKNMKGSDEPFDEVIFPELSREEAQRCLEEMKREMATSQNRKGKREYSPYIHENSVQSFSSSPSISNRSFADHDFRSPPQMERTYCRSTSYGAPDYVSRSQLGGPSDHRAMPSGSPYGSYSNRDSNTLPREIPDPYSRLSGSGFYSKDNFDRSQSPGVGTNPYPRYGSMGAPSPVGSYGSPSPLGGPYGSSGPRSSNPYGHSPIERGNSVMQTTTYAGHSENQRGYHITQPPPGELPYRHDGPPLEQHSSFLQRAYPYDQSRDPRGYQSDLPLARELSYGQGSHVINSSGSSGYPPAYGNQGPFGERHPHGYPDAGSRYR